MRKSAMLALAVFLSVSSAAHAMEIKSSTVKEGDMIGMDQVFNSFGCTGKNVSPDVQWSGAPEGTKAYALTMYDPDAPTGSGWWHWVVVNIPATAKEIPAGAGSGKAKMPAGSMQTRTDFGKAGYGGPCPPAGDKPHHYVFTIYALKDKLPVKSDATAALVGFQIHANKIAEASFTAKFGR
jgi:Raf kinase inhibitor-like YbhB/YbcL family protein